MKIFAIASVICIAILLSLNLSRYCYSNASFMSDETLTDLAIAYEIKKYRSKKQRLKYDMNYKSKEEFKKINKNCCNMENWYSELFIDDLLGKLLSFYNSEVSINYKIYIDPTGRKYLSYVRISSCGEIINSIGIEG